MARLLSQQDDFVNQTSMVETLITEAGHECLFLPKFHCELNPIKMVGQLLLTTLTMLILSKYWGWCKYCYQEHPKANFAEAKE
jgi:hypothetical protein